MKTKQVKEEQDKSLDEDTVIEPKTRARKKATDIGDEDKSKPSQDEAKTSKDAKKTQAKPRAIVKKRPLGIRKALRGKKVAGIKDKLKNVVKSTVTRGRKAAVKVEPESAQNKEALPLIPASEIKKEPVDETAPNSRSASPKTAGRKPRLSSDMVMMKSMLSDSPSTLVLGPRTSPYSMRSERSNSPSLFEGKNLRSGKPRKVKNNLLSEVVMKQQKKRRRLLSDSKNPEVSDAEDCKKLKRGRSCSRDGSEISKCSDNTESDLSLSETLNDSDPRELNKKLDKSKTDLDVDIENNIQISTIDKVPSLNVDSKLAESKVDPETSSVVNDKNKKLSLKRSTSLDSDNNNSNRIKLETLNSPDIEDKLLLKTENDTLLEARSSILTSMSKTFNSKKITKNMRRARRGRKAAAEVRRSSAARAPPPAPDDDKHETIETLSRDIDDLIKNLDQNIDHDDSAQPAPAPAAVTAPAPTPIAEPVPVPEHNETKSVAKFYGLNKTEDNTPATPVKEKDLSGSSLTNENTPSKNDESDNIKLHYEEEPPEKPEGPRNELPYTSVASIDKLMDRLKEFEEFDKRRQRLESESKPDSKPMMVTNDVVLIPKSGADIKPLKDIQSVRSPEKPFEKENVLSCFENNSAISIVKRDQVRKSIDVDLPNSVTLIKRNSVSARKESTSSNHSRESDTLSKFEKTLGKDVTLTEIRKSVDKSALPQVDLHQFATLHPNNSSQILAGVGLDSSQISITPRISEAKIASNDVQLTTVTKRKSRESKTSESADADEKLENKISAMKSPSHSTAVSITPAPVAIKSPESAPVETEALPPPLENIKPIPDVPKGSETPKTETVDQKLEIVEETTKIDPPVTEKVESSNITETKVEEKMDVSTEKADETKPEKTEKEVTEKAEAVVQKEEAPVVAKVEEVVVPRGPGRPPKNRISTESQPGPSNAFNETPESQKRKENVLRTLGLLTHKAAEQAKIDKQREKERICSGVMSNKGKVAKSSGDYTGTLKTVIKLNRGSGDRKKQKSSLKMTFQKSKYRTSKTTPEIGDAVNEDETFYTIERREGAAALTEGGQRKSHYSNRLNADGEPIAEPTEPKETLNLVIPEKASSFSIHPDRLCMDQCFYCGGKFGLFDTPLHIAQIKSLERQKKVLDNEEKLTIDSCLCDACYRHVDRRANCPSYRKRPLRHTEPQPQPQPQPQPHLHQPHVPPVCGPAEKPASPPMEEESEEEAAPAPAAAGARAAGCHAEGCGARADHAIRRKWLIKMRPSVNKLLKLRGDYPGLHTLPLCRLHHAALAPLMSCALCRRRLTKHHNIHFIHHEFQKMNPLLAAAGIPAQFAERPVLCKACRDYCALLQRGALDHYAHQYRRKLLEIYNIEVPPETDTEQQPDPNQSLEDGANKHKKKHRNKSKQRKSTDPDNSSEHSEKTNDSTPEKEQKVDDNRPLEEDIESLISSNKIPVPGAKSNDATPSEGSESETTGDPDQPALHVDKQTELQYLLQKQNNPSQFLQTTNLTQKQKNPLKIQSFGGITKAGQQHRISSKNAKRIHSIGQSIAKADKIRKDDTESEDSSREGIPILKNIPLNEECTIESIPNKKPADIATLKNKWQMSESFTQVKKNLSELSKKLTVEKEPKKSDGKYSNPVKRLETNPSISVRELFPGEEEMNLQCNIEFNNVKGVTPEGWEKCSTVIQYDVETKKLWTELQRPYGNQSSFLRHLILLEKYFRAGDLVLSHNAAPNAACYSESVQSRLRAYDNVPEPKRVEPVSLIEFRKKPSMNGKSLLKSNQTEDKETKKFMPPPPVTPKPKKDKAKTKQLPPELIAINTPNAQGRKAIQNVLHNIQQLVKGVSASDPTEVAAAPLPLPKFDAPPPKFDAPPPKEKKEKDKDTPKKSKSTKPWRPTLMPITPENLAKIASEPTQVAVDGRALPSLVQVMSSGKRYHITLQDYNKMCVMRREKLQQLRDTKKKRTSLEETTVVTELQPSTMLGNGGSVMQNINMEDKEKKDEMNQIGANAATILKNVGLKNITIAPIPAKTATVTSQTLPAPTVTSPSLLVSTPIKIPQLCSSVSITSETVLTPHIGTPMTTMTPMLLPKIPKSLTVIPQTMVATVPQNVVVAAPSQITQVDTQRP